MPASQKTVIALFVGLLVAALFLGPINTAVTENTGVQSVDNETVTAQHDQAVQLDGWDVVEGSVRVFNVTGAEVPTADYTINNEPGEINVSSSSTVVADGEQITVTYDYEATSGTTTTIAGFIVTLVLVVMVWIPARWIQENA